MLLFGAGAPADAAVVPAVKVRAIPATVYATQTVMLRGSVASNLRGSKVTLQHYRNGKWRTLTTVRASKRSGTWRARVRVPATGTTFKVRAVSGRRSSAVMTRTITPAPAITAQGPGGYLWGLDVSRWQHTDGMPWDYATMAANGAAFLMIKASDGTPRWDALATPWALIDADGAKKAGMFVGYYHYAQLPLAADGKPETSPSRIIANAKAQATTAAGRLAQLGGYDGQTLPYTLDIEEHYTVWTDPATNSDTTLYWRIADISLWTRTWYAEMLAQTGRKPIIYSYRSYMSGKFDFATNAETRTTLQSMHLWLAQPGDPGDPAVVVGQRGYKTGECYVMAWTKPGCNLLWTFWQYTNSADRERFGIPWSPSSGASCPADVLFCRPTGAGSRNSLDANVFSGTAGDLRALADGTWDRSPDEFQ